MVFNSEKSLMRTGLFSSRTKMISYLLLRFIADKDEPAGSWVLREDLLSFGIDCSTATIGRILRSWTIASIPSKRAIKAVCSRRSGRLIWRSLKNV